MSRSLGLREDQRLGQVLATLVQGLFPADRVGRPGQAALGAIAAVRPVLAAPRYTFGIVASIEGR